MNKYVFLLIMLFLSYQSHAQKNTGVMAGTGVSNLRIRNVPDVLAPLLPSEYQASCSFYIGGYADFSLSDLIFLSPEIFYANRGWKMVYDPLETTFRIMSNTIVLPILVKFNILKKLQVYTGPELSYAVDRNIKDLTNGAISIESTSESSFDIAISAGVSFDFIKNMSVDLRYNYGVLDLRETYYIPGDLIDPGLAGQQVPIDYEEYNWSFQIGLTYRFKIKD